MKENILIVDDEECIRYTYSDFLCDEGFAVSTACSYGEAVEKIEQTNFDLLFIDIIMEGKTGLDLLRTIREKSSDAQVVIITGAPSVETAAETVRLGALDYIVKPIHQHDLLTVTRVALQHKKLKEEKDRNRANLDAIFSSVDDGIITVDPDRNIIDINAAAISLCGLHDSQNPVRLFASSQHHCSAACHRILTQALSSKKSVERHYIECRKKNDSRQIVSISASPLLDRKKQFCGCVMMLRDETRLLDLKQHHLENSALKRIVGHGQEIQKVKEMIRILADVQSTVLITGESGTGKELTVEALHCLGNRATKPLIKVNCGALTDTLLESELFGHVHGAFTGAVHERTGRFQLADGGTIFLDEIGDISPKMQLLLLRVLETMTFEKVGSSTSQKVDVRVVAATNRDLAERVREGLFRQDLYYRLKVVQLEIPPLRQRSEDIPALTQSMIGRFNRRFNKDIEAVSSDVEKLFLEYSWPGNIRELENILEYAFILCNQKVITITHLPPDYQVVRPELLSSSQDTGESEPTAITEALEKTGGNKAKAAKLLGISRRTIYRKMDKYGIP